MAKIIILYSTTDGHTQEICCYLRQLIEKSGDQVAVVSLAKAMADDNVGILI